ncbi:MAG: hypothetical protein HZC38_20270 [Chloroflexi bacterium]|nr:hypothetical protein [Chloroflexota bacterium]
MQTKLSLPLTLIFIITACAAPQTTTSPTSIPKPTQATLPTATAAPPIATLAPTQAKPTATLPPAEAVPLFQKGMKESADRYKFAVQQGAKFVTTPDSKSFYVLWYPSGSSESSRPPMIVTLHGHGSWAFDEFYLWQPYAAKRGYGIIALQWWFGGGETTNDYYQPQEIYRIFDTALREQKIKAGTVLFHGFSRGSANSYGITALDRDSKNNYFALTISNAGKASSDFPINGEIAQGKFGAKPFTNTHWVMVCGMKDPNPDRDGCIGMEEARKWVTQYGGAVDLFIQDPDGDHGAFHRNANNVNAALDVFDKILKSR